MANNTLIYAAGGAAALYIMSQKDKPAVDPLPNTFSIEIIPANPGGPTIVLPPGNTPITGISGTHQGPITALSIPNFETWTRPEWAAYFLALYDANGIGPATQTVWSEWQNSNNEAEYMFPTSDSFAFNLITYTMASNIGIIITADSIPVYGTMSNWWNSIHYWNCTEWRQWFDLNLQKFGTDQARARFIDAWSHNDNNSPLGFESMGIMCGYDCDFINYMRTKGLDVANFGAENTCTLVSIPTNLIDAGAAVSEGVKNTANTVSFLAPLAVTALVGIFVYSQYQKTQ